mmetsp:Transcript_37961/g.44249  ORF Transcript_37961/g.44249 Transcript_37961/m.44249 type:complete len:334 (+) Transcript_37961:41-1042(+)
MKAAYVIAKGRPPVFRADVPVPEAKEGSGLVVVTVTAAALTNLTKAKAAGTHYTAAEGEGFAPFVPGFDGVGRTEDGRRVLFVSPALPTGSLGAKALVNPSMLIDIPDAVDDVTAAAIANPGMSVVASLVERARFVAGESVLINGATGAGGVMAVQVAKRLGAKRIVVTGRNAGELEKLRALGATSTVALPSNADAASLAALEAALIAEFSSKEGSIDAVVDYLWGPTARTIISAIAKGTPDAHRVRFVQVGGASGQENIDLPCAALRSSAIELLGSGLRSVPIAVLLGTMRTTLELASAEPFVLRTTAVPIERVEETWAAPGGCYPRVVFTL